MKINLQQQHCARFKTRIRDISGKIRYEQPYQKNLVTNWGMEAMKDTAALIQNIRIGSGSKEYTVEDSYLDSEIPTTKYTYDYDASTDSPKGYGLVIEEENNIVFSYKYFTASFTFNEAVNVSCTGLTNSQTTGDPMTTLARIKDTESNPTSLSIKDGETLEITYETRTYYDYAINNLGTLNVLIDGIPKEYTIRGRFYAYNSVNYLPNVWNYANKINQIYAYKGDLNEDLSGSAIQNGTNLTGSVTINGVVYPTAAENGIYEMYFSTEGTRKDHTNDTPYVTMLYLSGTSFQYVFELKDVDGLGIPVPTTSQFTKIDITLTYGRYTGTLNPVDVS